MIRRGGLILAGLLLSLPLAAKMKEVPLSDRLVSTNPAIRGQAVKEFHELPRETQEEFVPSLMVALTDDDPGVHADASRLLRELGHAPGQGPEELTPAAQREKQMARDADRKAALKEIQKDKKESFSD